jgi:hypothetical protein
VITTRCAIFCFALASLNTWMNCKEIIICQWNIWQSSDIQEEALTMGTATAMKQYDTLLSSDNGIVYWWKEIFGKNFNFCQESNSCFQDISKYESTIIIFLFPFYVNAESAQAEFQMEMINLQCDMDLRNWFWHDQLFDIYKPSLPAYECCVCSDHAQEMSSLLFVNNSYKKWKSSRANLEINWTKFLLLTYVQILVA